jgi:hypothetical protein
MACLKSRGVTAGATLTLPRLTLVDPLPETHCCIDSNAHNFMSLVLLPLFYFNYCILLPLFLSLVFMFSLFVLFLYIYIYIYIYIFFIVRVGSLGSTEYGDPRWSDPLPATPGIKQEEVLGGKNRGKKGVCIG